MGGDVVEHEAEGFQNSFTQRNNPFPRPNRNFETPHANRFQLWITRVRFTSSRVQNFADPPGVAWRTRLGGDSLAPELHDESKLTLSQDRLDRPYDPKHAADLYPLTDLKRLLLGQVTRRNHLLTAA